MSTIAYTSPFIPSEWIAAYDLRPCRLVPRAFDGADKLHTAEGVCGFARAFAADAVDVNGAGFVFTTTCDPMRRTIERTGAGARGFLFNVTATWQTVASQRLYVDELRRMGRWMQSLGGRAPSDERLLEMLRRWDGGRERARALRAGMCARAFAEALIELHATGVFSETVNRPAPAVTSLPVALIGGPLLRDEFWLYDAVERVGARVALDATETGERGLAAPLDRRRLHDEPLLGVLAEAYFGRMPDAFRRPNTRLYEYLKAGFAERGVRAVVLVRRVWCDLWRAEASRIREWCGLPCVHADLSGEGDVRQRVLTGLLALVESVK